MFVLSVSGVELLSSCCIPDIARLSADTRLPEPNSMEDTINVAAKAEQMFFVGTFQQETEQPKKFIVSVADSLFVSKPSAIGSAALNLRFLDPEPQAWTRAGDAGISPVTVPGLLASLKRVWDLGLVGRLLAQS